MGLCGSLDVVGGKGAALACCQCQEEGDCWGWNTDSHLANM